MIGLQSVDVAKVLRELADKIDNGQLYPRQVVLSEDRLEMDFYVRYRATPDPALESRRG